MTYKDMNELAHDAQSASQDAVGYLRELAAVQEDDREGRVECLEGAGCYLQRMARALDEYAHETEEVPEAEWDEATRQANREHGYWPTRRVLLSPDFELQAALAVKLDQLSKEINAAIDGQEMPERFASFDCSLADLADKVKQAYEAAGPAVLEDDGLDEPPGSFVYHPKC